QSGGNPLTFDNIAIPPGYDSIRVSFRLSAGSYQLPGMAISLSHETKCTVFKRFGADGRYSLPGEADP
ncbi:MAG: hypothetical protein ABF326_04005, partial [Arenicellales bacterium]